jgi:hypothetical protein
VSTKKAVFWVVAPCSLGEIASVSEVLAAPIITAIISTTHYNPEDSHLKIDEDAKVAFA